MFKIITIMKQRLLKTIGLALLMVVGASNAWAQTTIYASKQINFRTNSNSSPNNWDTGDWSTPKTKKDGLEIESIEANTTNEKPIFALEQFEIPNWSNVKSITITHKGTVNGAGLAVWLFPYTFYEADDYSSDFVGNTKTVLGDVPGGTYTETPAGTGTDAISLTLDVANNKINNMSFASFVSDNTLTLNVLLTSTNAASSQTLIKSAKESNGYDRPYLTVTYKNCVYNKTTSTYYDGLQEAITAAVTNATDAELEVSSDQIISARQTWTVASRKLTITPTADITITNTSLGNMWFLVNPSGGGAELAIGAADHSITFDGKNNSYTASVVKRENNNLLTLKNVTFKNISLDNRDLGLVHASSNNNAVTLDGITIKNCKNTAKGFIYCQRVVNNVIVLKGYLNLDETSYKAAPAIYTTNNAGKNTENGAININDDSFTASMAPIKIKWDNAPTTIGYGPLVTGIDGLANATDLFDFYDASYGFYADDDNLKLTQAYTLNIGEAGAATLVLPFESTIPTTPSGLTCYKLTYTSGDDIVATAEESTLGANKPVLVMGTASTSYKFVSTATSGDAATGSGQTSAYENMYGNYDTSWTVPTTTGDDANYILQNKASGLGFYKVVEGQNTLSPYRAYLSASFTSGSSARAFLGIRFGGDITDIQAVENEETGFNDDDAPVYNMSGMLMQGGNLPKGIYVKKGKKFIVK